MARKRGDGPLVASRGNGVESCSWQQIENSKNLPSSIAKSSKFEYSRSGHNTEKAAAASRSGKTAAATTTHKTENGHGDSKEGG